MTLDTHENVVSCNPAFEQLYGYTQAEIVGAAHVLREVSPHVHGVFFAEPDGAEELRVVERVRTTWTGRWHIERGPGIHELSFVDGRVIARGAGVTIESAPMFAVDAAGARRALSACETACSLRCPR